MGTTTGAVASVRPGAVAWRSVDDTVVLLDLASSEYHSLNGTSSRLWCRLADGGASQPDLVAALLEEYDVDVETAATDVEAFLGRCRARGWLSA